MQSYDIPQASASFPLVFLMVQSSDHISPLLLATPTVRISKNGAAFAAPAGAVTEIGNGWYQVAGNATDTNTLGPLLLHATATSGDPTDCLYPIVAFNPQAATNLGLSALPTANPGTANGLFVAGTNAATTVTTSFTTTFTGNLSGSVTGSVGSVSGSVGSVTGLTTAAIATAVWQDATAGDFTVASSIGKALYIANVAPGAAGGHFIAGSNAATTVNITGSLSGSVGSVTGLTTAAIATAVWQDATAGDFTVASSIGKALYIANIAPGAAGGHFIAGSNAATTVNITGSLSGSVGSVTGLTTAAIATAVWQDATAGDFTVASSPGKVLVGQLGGAFGAGTSAYTAAALVNAPSGTGASAATIAAAVWQDAIAGDFAVANSIGNYLFTGPPSWFSSSAGPTAAQIATAVWTDSTSSDFTTPSSPGKVLVGQLGGAFTTTSSSVYATAALANAPSGGGSGADPWAKVLPGAYTTGMAGYIVGTFLDQAISAASTLDFTQAIAPPRDLTAVPVGAITVADALWAAVCAATGVELVIGTNYYVKTPMGETILRVFTLDSSSAPTSRT